MEVNKGEDESTAECVSSEAAALLEKLRLLEAENRKMQNEFNAQRAKLKDLFIQKETEHTKCQSDRQLLQREFDDLKSQFVVATLKTDNEMRIKDAKAHEEISSLQRLVQDTIEESTMCKAELERIKEENTRLIRENRDLREDVTQQQQESTGIAPQVFSQVKKTLARKLGGDSGSSVGVSGSGSCHPESSDDTHRSKASGKQYAHEDAEVLLSIVVPLQEEMNALKEKLREADEKLQAQAATQLMDSASSNRGESQTISKATSMDKGVLQCDTCNSYEEKVKQLLAKSTEEQEKIDTLQKNLQESCDDLQKEAALRKDLEDQWQEKREAHKVEVQLLREQVKSNEKKLLDLQQTFLETKEGVIRQLQHITDERERINKHLETLQADNDFLSGRYLATSEEIENQDINLPNTVDELHELILRQQNELIQARVSSEYEKQKCVTSLDEIQILRAQLDASNSGQRAYKEKVQTEIKSLQDRLTDHLLTMKSYETTKSALERKETELNRQISELRVEIIELQESNEKLSKVNADFKAKIKNLQDDLITSEQVQKDFVTLSQTLQMSLEKLRHADTEVRWQEDDDIDNCPSCKTNFTVTVRKVHCRHCGHIYCDKCLGKTVPSGPRRRVARVCDICHTLLTPNKAPYFSQEPPQLS